MRLKMAENKEISLAEFIKGEHEKLDRFNQNWLEENKKDPESFPLSLPFEQSGHWIEFFFNFVISS